MYYHNIVKICFVNSIFVFIDTSHIDCIFIDILILRFLERQSV